MLSVGFLYLFWIHMTFRQLTINAHNVSYFPITDQVDISVQYICGVPGGIRRNVPLQHFTEDDEYLRIISR